MDHYTFQLEVCHNLMGISLPSDYAKPREKEVPLDTEGTPTFPPSANWNDGTTPTGTISSGIETQSLSTACGAEPVPDSSLHFAQAFSSIATSVEEDLQAGFEVPSSQESISKNGNVQPVPLPIASGQRRRRPNRRVRPEGVDVALPNPWAPHHSIRSDQRRKCR